MSEEDDSRGKLAFTLEEGEEEENDDEESNNKSSTSGLKGNKIFAISRDLEDLSYHLASVFPSFTKDVTIAKSKSQFVAK